MLVVTSLFFFFLFLNFILFLNFTILYWFCHISKWIRHRHTCVPHPEPSSLLPPHTIPLGRPSAPAPSIQHPASNLDWRLVSYMIVYMFQWHSPKSSHPLPLPQSPKDCSIHQCLFCCLVYRVIVTIFLNNIIYEMSHQSRFDARYSMLGAGALGRPRGMVQGGEEGGGFRMGNTCILLADSCWYMAKPIQYCKVKK